MRKLLVLLLFFAASALAQSNDDFGMVDLYKMGSRASGPIGGGITMKIDNQISFKVKDSEHVVLKLRAGEHQIEGRLGSSLNAVAIVFVKPGETEYVILDYKRPSIASLYAMKDPRLTMNLTLEHTNAPPDGNFKLHELKTEEVVGLSALPPFHEEAPASAEAEIVPLSDADIAEAIVQGRHIPSPMTIGLMMEDLQTQYLSGVGTNQGVSGFTIWVYTAKQWVELQAALAQRDMRPFTEADVTPEMKQQLLHVSAIPSTPDRLTGANMAAADNANRIVLELGPSKTVLQPLLLAPVNYSVDSALRSANYQGVMATFPQPDIKKPFSIVVIGGNTKKEFEVKDKHLARLK